MERSVMAFGNQYNGNYFIYDYVFTNTGIYDADGNTQDKTLTDVYFIGNIAMDLIEKQVYMVVVFYLKPQLGVEIV